MSIEGEKRETPTIASIGVIGAGQMGGGIIQVLALAGYDVVLIDINQEQIDRALERASRLTERQVEKGALGSDERETALAKIKTGSDFALLANCELIIEAATENEGVKRDILSKVVEHANKDALIASNTSSISITRLAAATDRPERFIGMHFMNPVPAMKLVELIRGIATDEPTFQATKAVIERLDKVAVTAEDFPAFIVNRILLPMINEAVYTLYEGVGNVEAIDSAMKLGA
ncbi:MAG: 3-hydroxyacyl-CoA dehydrogenase NAD-binding domain-containing protein, partial [Pseudomonadota bacterium]